MSERERVNYQLATIMHSEGWTTELAVTAQEILTRALDGAAVTCNSLDRAVFALFWLPSDLCE